MKRLVYVIALMVCGVVLAAPVVAAAVTYSDEALFRAAAGSTGTYGFETHSLIEEHDYYLDESPPVTSFTAAQLDNSFDLAYTNLNSFKLWDDAGSPGVADGAHFVSTHSVAPPSATDYTLTFSNFGGSSASITVFGLTVTDFASNITDTVTITYDAGGLTGTLLSVTGGQPDYTQNFVGLTVDGADAFDSITLTFNDNTSGMQYFDEVIYSSEPTFIQIGFTDTPDVVLQDAVLFASQGGDGTPYESIALGDLDLGEADHTLDYTVGSDKTHWWLIGHVDSDIMYSSNADLSELGLFDVEPFDPLGTFTETGIREMLEALNTGDPVPSLEQYIYTATNHSTHAALDEHDASLWQFSSPGVDSGLVTVSMFTIPEPSTFILLVVGGAALLAYGWRRRRR